MQASAMEVSGPEIERPRSEIPGLTSRSGCFPIQCFRCCPGIVAAIIPGTWQNIQDATHLALVAGVIASILLVFDTLYEFFNGNFCASGTFCIREALALIFIFPCILYFIRVIGQYDQRLQAKQRDAKEQKEQLTKAYNTLLSEMDGLLTKSAESSAGLAERSFESKRRDFQRFLERAKSRYSQLFNGSKVDNDKLLENFRRFVMNWLLVFEECSIDPVLCPKRVVTLDELQRCTTIGEVCDMTLERLRVTEVRFISIQRDQDQQMIKKTRNDFRRMTAAATDPRALENGQSMAAVASSMRTLTTELNPGSGGTNLRCTWFSFGSAGCLCSRSETADGYPKEVGLVCCRLVLLSAEHVTLLAGFIVGWCILVLELMSPGGTNNLVNLSVIIEVMLNEICIMVLLIRFEEIDVIQQLEREVKQLKKAEQNVSQQREKMQDFWSQAQQLTELWLYRTVPRLDLYKEVHCHLEDAPNTDINNWMAKANEQLELVEKNLGELEDWRNEGKLSVDSKKTFGKTINQLCQEQDFEHIARKLEDITSNGFQCLEAPSPSPAPKASPTNPGANLVKGAAAGANLVKGAAAAGANLVMGNEAVKGAAAMGNEAVKLLQGRS